MHVVLKTGSFQKMGSMKIVVVPASNAQNVRLRTKTVCLRKNSPTKNKHSGASRHGPTMFENQNSVRKQLDNPFQYFKDTHSFGLRIFLLGT